MKRVMALTCAGLCWSVVACQTVPGPVATGTASGGPVDVAAKRATLTFTIAWPRRTVQTIPNSTTVMRLSVLKGTTVVAQQVQRRFPSPTAQFSLQLNADSGLSVLAEAFALPNVTSVNGVPVIPASTTPVASASLANVTLVPNQHLAVSLSLIPAFIPQIATFSPQNGGPGINVTLTGSFGSSGPYTVLLGGNTCSVLSFTGPTLVVAVPYNGSTGAWTAQYDGVSSPATGSFQVLQTLNLLPRAATTSVGQSLSFSVPTGLDTNNATVSNPTVTGWAIVDPTTGGTTSVGTLSASGSFQAQATGAAVIQVYSGTLKATTSVLVQ
jgi:hypothetical protein